MMQVRPGTAKFLRMAALLALAGYAIFALTPALRNHFGSVAPKTARLQSEDFSAVTLQGRNWSLEDQKGRVTLVNFWATWCPPCRVEIPGLVNLQSRYSDRGFTVAGVTMDEDLQHLPEFVRKHGITYPVLIPKDNSGMLDQVQSIPTSFLIDRSGKIARTYSGIVAEARLAADIEALLKEND